MDIGKEVVSHIEIMYPAAFSQLPGSGKISIRNCIHNQIMAALDTVDVNEIRARLDRRRAHRRAQLKAYRGFRSTSPPSSSDTDAT